MKITVRRGPTWPRGTSLVAVAVVESSRGPRIEPAWRSQLPRGLRLPVERQDVSARPGSTYVWTAPPGEAVARVLFVGVGDPRAADAETLRRFAGHVGRQARSSEESAVVALLPRLGRGIAADARVRAVSEGITLGAYAFDRYRKKKGGRTRPPSVSIVGEDDLGLAAARRESAAGVTVGENVNVARDLGNLPGNALGPTELAAAARRVGRDAGLSVRVLDDRALKGEGMHALLAVSQGSRRPARLIVLEHKPPGTARQNPLVFVGKAITFDSGGISIKNAGGMQDMKFDMCGGAAVVGALGAIGQLGLRRRVIGLVSAAENMPDGSAYRPGDVLKTAAGPTVEVINTDAEGRLALADALHYAKRFSPDLVVDLATLTGACVVALGHTHAGLFGEDDRVVDRVQEAARRAGERVWPMPVHAEHKDLMRSEVADLRNSGGRPAAACSAAAFLSYFIEGHPWTHLDIAGTAWADRVGPYHRKGATGFGVRTLVELARE